VAYAFDCGATTDFSLEVSLLRANKSLPKYKLAPVLYSQHHDYPTTGTSKNVEVSWIDTSHVTVRIAGFEGTPQTKKQDSVQIRLEKLP